LGGIKFKSTNEHLFHDRRNRPIKGNNSNSIKDKSINLSESNPHPNPYIALPLQIQPTEIRIDAYNCNRSRKEDKKW
jgi:hypothetical protein